MAEIKIEKKSPVWPWVLLGLILLALLAYFLVFRDNNDADDAAAAVTDTVGQYSDTTNAGANTANEGAVADFVRYVNDPVMGPDHEFTATGLEKLAAAIRAKSEKAGYNLNTELDRATTLADKIREDASATTHANSIREAASVLTTAMGNLQEAKYQDLSTEMADVKQAAGGISGDTQTLEQKESVKSFFQRSAELLQKMN